MHDEFTNEVVIPENLPKAENLSFTQLEPAILKVWRINLIFFHTLLAAGISVAFFLIDPWQNPWAITLAVVLFAVVFILSWLNTTLSYRWSGYALREHDLVYRSGWLRRRLRLVPLSRIQHLSVVSGWLERHYGLASLSIYTAAQSDFAIPGLKYEQAQNLKAWSNSKINTEEGHGGS